MKCVKEHMEGLFMRSIAGDEVFDGFKVENLLHQQGIIRHRVDYLHLKRASVHHEFLHADFFQIHLQIRHRLVLLDAFGQFKNLVGESVRSRACKLNIENSSKQTNFIFHLHKTTSQKKIELDVDKNIIASK